jgi:DNA repair protein RecO (recombination protein O)
MRVTVGESSAGFVLHTYPYRETSLIVEAFTRTHGRMAFVAKGAKRPTATMRAILNPFQGLAFAWFGKADMKTLKSAEHERILPQLSGAALMSAFYMNELIIKLAHREDAHEALFEAYSDALVSLSSAAPEEASPRELAVTLRKFELTLLRELGYALQLSEEAGTHAAIDERRAYMYVMERGPIPLDRIDDERVNGAEGRERRGLKLRGKTLLDLANGDYSDATTLAEAKQLTRAAINQQLGDKFLHTRQLIRELRDL